MQFTREKSVWHASRLTVNPAAASLATRREGCAAVVLHSGAGHTSFVLKTVPKATYADEFLFFKF